MSGAPPARWPLVVLCGSIVLALSVGARQVSGLFLAPVTESIGLSAEAFGLAVAVQNLVWGLSQPLAGRLADRAGARPVVAACGLLYAAGMALAAFATGPLTFTLGLGVLCGLGQAGTAFAVTLAVIGRAAPEASRQTALAIGSTAGSVGLFMLVPLAGAFMTAFDWRPTLLGIAALLTLIPLLGMALREPRAGAPIAQASLRQIAAAIHGDRDYWLINLGFAACGFTLAFIATYLPTMLAGAGLGTAAGALALGAIGLFNIPGTYMAGIAGARWRKSRVLVVVYLARAAAILAFLALPISLGTALAFGAAIGLFWTSTVPLTSGLVASLWGRRNLGFLFGLVYVGHQLGAFLGAWAGGLALQHAGSLAPVWAACVLVSLAAAGCHLLLDERPRKLARAELPV